MSESISDLLNPDRPPREAYGLKAEKTLNRITLTPSSVNPGETLYASIPTLTESVVIVPGIVGLLFNLNVVGHTNNTIVNNVGRNLVKSLKVKFGGEVVYRILNVMIYSEHITIFFFPRMRGRIDLSKVSHP